MIKRRRRSRYPLVNGVPASKTQIKLGASLNGNINHKPSGCKFYIDIALLDQEFSDGTVGNIGIEVDSWLYHKNKQRKDKIRVNILRKLGWRMISIKYAKNLPRVGEILDAVQRAKLGEDYVEIITMCWLNAEDNRKK